MKRYVWYVSILGFSGSALRVLSSKVLFNSVARGRESILTIRNRKAETLNLEPNEWVKVRSPKEIFASLMLKANSKGFVSLPKWPSSAEKD